MTRADLVEKLSMRLDVSKTNADKYLLVFLDAIMNNLEKEGKVVVQGFGSFKLREYKARTAKKPLTGEKYELPSRRKPVFHAGKELREIINQKSQKHKTVWREKQIHRPIALSL